MFTNPTEPFWVYTKLAMYGALLVASPFIIWELWKFVAPGLYRKEKRMALLVTIATAVCFIGRRGLRLRAHQQAGADVPVRSGRDRHRARCPSRSSRR